ncbi:hypothetical protein [Nocardioides sp. KR10-350]|uniref:hypothetical protein n=1 Tax=Nocardioides cheoyonin TaxID=3156615 RepID=UPI0032B31319
MSWEEDLFALFDDLESQAEAAYARDREAELEDRSRAEYAEVAFAARLMASVGRDVAVDVRGVGTLQGTLERVAKGWFLVSAGAVDWVVRQDAVGSIAGAADRAVPDVAWPAVARLGLGSALRRLAEAGERCLVHRTDGVRHEGVVRRVGADFVELLSGEAGRVVLVPFGSLAAVQSRPV